MSCMGAGLSDTRIAGTCPDCGADVNAAGEAVDQCPDAEPECDTCDQSWCSGAC